MTPCELVVCDDGSTDDTLELVKQFSSRVPFPVHVYCNEQQLGVIKNYSRAVSLCSGDYVALCDQDDIWLPNKLDISMQSMRDAEKIYENGTPLLLHTDLQVVDQNGNMIARSLMKTQKIHHVEKEPLKTLLVQNFVTGCTTLLNRPLINIALPIPVESLMHDWWFALMAAALGKLIFIPQSTVLYRQHSHNAVGAKKYLSGKNITRLAKVNLLEQMIAKTVRQGLALANSLEHIKDSETPNYLCGYLEAALQNGKNAASYACSHKIAKQGWVRNTVFLILLYKSDYLECLGEHCALNSNYR